MNIHTARVQIHAKRQERRCIFIEIHRFFTNCVKFIDFFTLTLYNKKRYMVRESGFEENPRGFSSPYSLLYGG